MRRRGWIILLAVGVALAVVIGILATGGGESRTEAEQNLCGALAGFESTASELKSLDPATASQDEFQTLVSDLENGWTRVESDAREVVSVDMSTLEKSWDEFEQAVESVPSGAKASDAIDDVSQAAQSLASTTKSTIGSLDCS